MITEQHFINKITEIAHMRLITIPKETARSLYPRFKDFDPRDFDQATEAVMMGDDRFDFRNLLKICTKQAIYRRESEANQDKNEWNRFEKNWPQIYSGECSRTACRGCNHTESCRIRGGEWLKNINSILKHGGGKEKAEELIHFMHHEFMGGIK
ncbi:MAG: hypothetical protein V1679_00060 [Candidatus Peregrinibacteria bacterium]